MLARAIRSFRVSRRPFRVEHRTVLVRRRYVSSIVNQPSVASTPPIQLRDYQEDCIQAVLSHLEKGNKRLGVSLATGSGKTVIFTHLIDRVAPSASRGTQTLILVHRRELAEQAARHCIAAYPNKMVEVEMGAHHAKGAADITVASIQSLLSSGRLAKFHPKRFKLVLVDEAHHIVAPGYLAVLDHFGLLRPARDAPEPPPAGLKALEASPALVGVSATLSRFDGVSLGAALDHIVYHKDYVDMIDERWLASVVLTTVRTQIDLRKVRAAATGDFAPGALSQAVNTPSMNEVTVRTWLARAAERRSTIVFCVDIAHVRDLTAEFVKHGVAAQYVTGEDRARDRDAKLEAFKRGEYRVLLNCGVFTEGTDVPNVDCVLLARPTRSRNLLVQMIGRGLRLHPDKENCHVIDMVSALSTGIVTTPTLFGLDPFELVNEASTKDLRKLKAQSDENSNKSAAADDPHNSPSSQDSLPRKITFTDYDNVQDLIEDTSGERHIRAISQYAWVQVDEDQYRLTDSSRSFIAIDKDDPKDGDSDETEKGKATFSVRLVEKLPDKKDDPKTKHSRFKRPRLMSQGMLFTNAVQAADTLADKWFVRNMILKNASWRKVPATDGQIAYLNKFREPEEHLTTQDVSKGAAMEWITKIRFGARGRFKEIKAAAVREQRQHAKAQGRAQREAVRVGPVGIEEG